MPDLAAVEDPVRGSCQWQRAANRRWNDAKGVDRAADRARYQAPNHLVAPTSYADQLLSRGTGQRQLGERASAGTMVAIRG